MEIVCSRPRTQHTYHSTSHPSERWYRGCLEKTRTKWFNCISAPVPERWHPSERSHPGCQKKINKFYFKTWSNPVPSFAWLWYMGPSCLPFPAVDPWLEVGAGYHFRKSENRTGGVFLQHEKPAKPVFVWQVEPPQHRKPGVILFFVPSICMLWCSQRRVWFCSLPFEPKFHTDAVKTRFSVDELPKKLSKKEVLHTSKLV